MSIVTLDTGDGGSGGGEDDAAFIEALRHRAADSLERAYRFLETQPDTWALLRAQVLCQARPAGDLAVKLGETARADGSLPLGTLISGGEVGFPPIALDAPPAPNNSIDFPAGSAISRKLDTNPLPSVFSPMNCPSRLTTQLTAPIRAADSPNPSS